MLSFVLEDVDRLAAAAKLYAQQVRGECVTGNVPSSRILDMYINLKQYRSQFAAAATTPGIGPYAQTAKNNATLDVVAEFNNMVAKIDAVTAWLETNFPKDGSGFLLAKLFSAGTIIDRLFTAAQLANFVTQLDGLIAAIS